MSFDYDKAAQETSQKQIAILEEYYTNWSSDFTINTKFRFFKVFGRYRNSERTKWVLLHHFVNKRRITNDILPKVVLKLFDLDFIPIRLFQRFLRFWWGGFFRR